MKFIALFNDVYGGRGGIATYNRCLLKALNDIPDLKEIYTYTRSSSYEFEEIPPKIIFENKLGNSYIIYFFNILKKIKFKSKYNLIICGHLNLLPIAKFLGFFLRVPILQIIYGTEAINPSKHLLVNFFARRITNLLSIRKLTTKKFLDWSKTKDLNKYFLPNSIFQEEYGVKIKNPNLVEKFQLLNKKVILTVGRVDTMIYEKRKGFDEVIEALPDLRKIVPEVNYLIVGDGDGITKLKNKAKKLGVLEIVKFTGYVSDKEKADFYRLADVFAMPGSNPLFDRYPYRFVFLEALACGIPVVACELEYNPEKNDIDNSKLIIQVDPNSKESIIKGILKGLNQEKEINKSLKSFYFESFQNKLQNIIFDILKK